MTDPLSERLEEELRPAVRNYCGSEDCRPLLKLMIEAVLPILRDEIAAVRERTLEEAALILDNGHFLTGDSPEHKWAIQVAAKIRALKTPQPEVSK